MLRSPTIVTARATDADRCHATKSVLWYAASADELH